MASHADRAAARNAMDRLHREAADRHGRALAVRSRLIEDALGNVGEAGLHQGGLESILRTLYECNRHLREWREAVEPRATMRGELDHPEAGDLEAWEGTVDLLWERWQRLSDRALAPRGTVEKRTALEVVSQPGDGTRYHYLMIYREGAIFFIGFNHFRYPVLIWEHEVQALRQMTADRKQETLQELCDRNRGLNPFTGRECYRAAAAYLGQPFDLPLDLVRKCKEAKS